MQIEDRWREAGVEAVEAAGQLLRARFRGPVARARKAAASPIVTEADLAVERAMREILRARTPDARVVGEELDDEGPEGDWTWVIDPIDGTIAFASGRPLFCTLLGLLHRGEPVLGVVDQPILGDRWVGARGQGVTLRGGPSRAAGTTRLSEARLASTTPAFFDRWPGLRARLCGAAHVVSWGGDAYNYGALASGWLDAVVEAELALHDYAALVPVVEGAGGVITDWEGRSLAPAAGPRDVIAAATPALHAELLALMISARA
jgi:histidinol phosphatase-like enzyme (inositol monophosphatase family)